jgi:glycosyltransferase involved in cell wall biosynthesis
MSEPPVRPPIASAPVSVVLIAYEPVSDLPALLNSWKTVLEARGEYEIILLDDRGNLLATPDDLAAQFPALRFIRHELRRGFGASLRAGVEAARHPLLFYTTADGQYLPDDLKKLLEQIDQVDLVTGFRRWQPVPAWLRGLGATWRAFMRVVMGVKEEKRSCWLGWPQEWQRVLARVFFGLRVQDVNCAFRLFRREVLDRIPIQSNGAFAQVEVLAKANFLAWMAEVAVQYSPPSPAGAKYCLTWDRAEIAQTFSNPEFRPPPPPPAPAEPRTEPGTEQVPTSLGDGPRP